MLKNPTKCIWRWTPDRRSVFFCIPPAHICAVTYMTKISLNVTLNNQIHLTSQRVPVGKQDKKWVSCWGYMGMNRVQDNKIVQNSFLVHTLCFVYCSNLIPMNLGKRDLNTSWRVSCAMFCRWYCCCTLCSFLWGCSCHSDSLRCHCWCSNCQVRCGTGANSYFDI